ncbi:MAG: LuxR C-terminal-related transcriptional regulator [Nitrospira sp.]|nr:LuxR C-terminal-related transcriptional regulator [Nitrospira sp.]
MHDGTRVLHGALDSLDSAVVNLSPRGRIARATPRAERLLLDYQLVGTRTRDHLHHTIIDWLRTQEQQLASPSELPHAIRPLVCSGSEGTLTIRLIRQGPLRLLLLEKTRTIPCSTTLAHLGLSRRETEILSWVAQGKSNAEIGTILGISSRTVQKHLERIYSKLGVENRHAAVAMMRSLNE